MRLLPYYFAHTFVNGVKKLFKTWVAIFIAIIVLCGVIGGIVGSVAGSVAEKNQPETEEVELTPEEQEEKRALTMEIVEAAIGAAVIVVLIFNFYSGDKSGSNIFTMSDVNFLFPAPLKPQSVLMFRVLLQMGLIIVGSLYLLFQIPNLVLNLGVPTLAAIMLIAAWIVTMMTGKLIAVFTYTVTATHRALRRWVLPASCALAAVAVAVYGGTVLLSGLAPLDAAFRVFGSGASRYIPVLGWTRGLVMYAVEGNWGASLLCLLGNLAVCALLVWLIGMVKADFYEDALGGAEKRQELAEAAKAGTQNGRKRSEKLMRGEIGRGQGGEMFFYKSAYNRRRFARFGVVSKTGATYLALCILGAVITRLAAKSTDITIMAFVLLVIVFFRNYGNPIAMETGLPFLYMVPDTPGRKLLYALLAGTYDTALDLIPAFFIAVVVTGAGAAAFGVWLLLFITADFFASCSGLFIQMVVPDMVVPAVRDMLQMFLKMAAALPAIIILAVGTAMGHVTPALLIASAVNAGLGALLFIFCPRLLHAGR